MLLELLIIPAMTILASLAGGSFPYSNLLDKVAWLPEALMGVLVALVTSTYLGYWAILAGAWMYIWMQTGHHHALYWGEDADPERSNTLTPFVDFLARKFDVKRFGRGYSALFFSVKGFLMTLPLGGAGAIFWPLAYDLGVLLHKKDITGKNNHTVTELLSGFFLGVWCYIFLLLVA